MVLDDLSQSHPNWNPAEEAKRCFSLRVLERFASSFGFADVRMPGRHQVRLPLEIKKASFLDSWISFRIEYQ